MQCAPDRRSYVGTEADLQSYGNLRQSDADLVKVLVNQRQIAESEFTLDVRADGLRFCVDPTVAASLSDHLCKGRCPCLVVGTPPQRTDQIDGHERIVVVEEGDPLPRARLEACANFQHEFEPVEVQRICQLHAF